LGIEIVPLDSGDGAEKCMLSGVAKEFGEKFSPEGVMVTSIVTIKPNQVISPEV
jgi:hypothetical protein